MKRRIHLATASALALALATGTAGVANATPVTESEVPSVVSIVTFTMTEQDWQNLAAKAEQAGDLDSAIAANKMAQRTKNGANPIIEERGIASWIKKAVIAVLKYESHRLPKWIQPYATKIAYALESIEGMAELPLTAALIKMGVDGGTAAQMAHYMVLFASTFGPI